MRIFSISLIAGAALVLPTTASAVAGSSTPANFDPAAPAHGGFTITAPTDPYLMAFHTCSTGSNCDDPANHLIRLASSPDGATWTGAPGWQPYRGSVPDVIRRGNTSYLVGAGLSKINMSTGAVTAHSFSTKDSAGADTRPRDVSFAGQLPDGRFVIVYVPSMQEVNPASNDRTVLLATENVGSDGTAYTNVGNAITISKAGLPIPGDPTDPDIFWNGSQWVLYVSLGSNVISYTSPDILGPYSLASQTTVSLQSGGVGSGVLAADGTTVFSYVNAGSTRNDVSIKFARTTPTPALIPAATWQAVITPSTYGTATAESPGVARNTTGVACVSGCAATTATTATASVGKPGGTCKKVGATGTYKGKAMVCQKVKGRLLWARA